MQLVKLVQLVAILASSALVHSAPLANGAGSLESNAIEPQDPLAAVDVRRDVMNSPNAAESETESIERRAEDSRSSREKLKKFYQENLDKLSIKPGATAANVDGSSQKASWMPRFGGKGKNSGSQQAENYDEEAASYGPLREQQLPWALQSPRNRRPAK